MGGSGPSLVSSHTIDRPRRTNRQQLGVETLLSSYGFLRTDRKTAHQTAAVPGWRSLGSLRSLGMTDRVGRRDSGVRAGTGSGSGMPWRLEFRPRGVAARARDAGQHKRPAKSAGRTKGRGTCRGPVRLPRGCYTRFRSFGERDPAIRLHPRKRNRSQKTLFLSNGFVLWLLRISKRY